MANKSTVGTVINPASGAWSTRIMQSIPASYTIWKDGSNYIGECNVSGGNDIPANTDATAVIEAAMAALTPGRSWQEKICCMGDFTIGSTVDLVSNVILEIQGKWSLAAGLGVGTHMFQADAISNATITGGVLDGTRASQTQLLHGINAVSSSKVEVYNTKLQNFKGWGIYIYESSDCRVERCELTTIDEGGIAVEATNNHLYRTKILSNTITATGLTGTSSKNGVHVEGNEGTAKYPYQVLVEGNHIYSCRGQGVIFSNAMQSIASNNFIHDNYIQGITIYHSTGITIDTNELDGNDVGNTGGYENGIRVGDAGVTASDDIVITNNLIKNHDGWAIIERGCTNLLVEGNNVRNNGSTISHDSITMKIRNNVGYNPRGTLTNPFGTNILGDFTGGVATPTASTDYEVVGNDLIIGSTDSGNADCAILIKNPNGTQINPTAFSTLQSVFVPIGYKVNWGAYTGVAPTVLASGL